MIASRWRQVQDRVAAACAKAGRSPSDVTIVAVSKMHPASAVAEAVDAGVTDVGENYVQELLAKRAAVSAAVGWHFIGRLQRNKARQIAGQVVLIHSVDSPELVSEIDRRVVAGVQPVLIAINVAGEASKGGVAPGNAAILLSAMAGLSRVRCDGFMTMPPPVDRSDDARPYFAALRDLRDRLATRDRPLPILSMGMSDDFEAAIVEGATHVRIGTAIFGARG